MKVKPYYYFIRKIIWINCSLSLLFGALATGLVEYVRFPLLTAFSFFFATFGYAITILIFHFFGERTKYLYFNLGISLIRLYLIGFIFNIILLMVFYLIANILWMLKSYM